MVLDCEIVPRSDATPDQLKALGTALARWFESYRAHLASSRPNVDDWIDSMALSDLAAGELPLPFLLRLQQAMPGIRANDIRNALERSRAAFPLAQRSIPSAHARSICFGFTIDESDRDNLISDFHSSVPLDLIADVMINGRSWRGGE